jgi:SET domain-containing protein
VNHSCEPNLVSRIVRGHILYLALRDIQPGEELTIDYRFDKDVEKVVCRCGSEKCRGTINLLK